MVSPRSVVPVLAAAVLLLSGTAAALLVLRPGPVAATVNGEPIYREEVDRYVHLVALRHGLDLTAPDGARQRRLIAQKVLEQLIDRTLILQQARRRNLLPSVAEVESRLREIRGRFASEAEFESALRSSGLGMDELRSRVRFELALHRFLQSLGPFPVSEAELRAEYDRDPSRFDLPPRARVRHILVRTEAEARVVRSRVEAGEPFAELARTLSLDPTSRDRGGDLGWVLPRQLLPEIDRLAFSLPVGVTSPPVRTRLGYHIVQVLARTPARRATFESARERVREVLVARKQQEALARWLQVARSRVKITTGP